MKTEKIFCTCRGFIRSIKVRPRNRPKTEPKIKGTAAFKLIEPVTVKKNTLPVETIAITPRVVPTIDFMGKLVNF